MLLGEFTPASSGHSSVDISPRSVSSGPKSPWRMPSRKMTLPIIRRPPSPELTNLDCAFPPFPNPSLRSKTTVHDNRSKSDLENEHMRMRTGTYNQSAASSPRTSSFGGSSTRSKRALSISSTRPRNTTNPKSSIISQPMIDNNIRRPSLNGSIVMRSESGESLPLQNSLTQDKPYSTSDWHNNTKESRQESESRASLSPGEYSPEAERLFQTSSTQEQGQMPVPLASRNTDPNGSGEQLHTSIRPQDPKTNIELSSKPKQSIPADGSKSLPLVKRFKSILTPRRTQNVSSESQSLPEAAPENSIGKLSETRSLTGPEKTAPFAFHFGDSSQKGTPAEESVSSYSDISPNDVTNTSSSPDNFASATRQDDEGSRQAKPASEQILNVPEARTQASEKTTSHPGAPSQETKILHDEDIRELENLVSLAPGLTPSDDPRNTIRTSTDSASSYASTLSLPTTSSRSSLAIREDTQFGGSPLPNSLETVESIESESLPLMHPRIPEIQPDSPTDPLLQAGRLSPIPSSSHRQTSSGSSRASRQSSIKLELPVQTKYKQPRTAGIKGICRGCSLVITATQKSVVSADGRLSGRYHKSCFVCTKCRLPFATADFYVHGDHPYCSQHYHELNGTICAGCGKGIEGQYMETSSVSASKKGGGVSKKFHTECLSCTTCRSVLKEDYFEFNGRVYCERDAFRLASLPGRAGYDSAPTRPSPLIRELVTTSGGSAIRGGGEMIANAEQQSNPDEEEGDKHFIRGEGSLMGLSGKFPERRLTKLMDTAGDMDRT